MKIKAKNGKEYYLVDVIAQILKYLKIELIEKQLKQGGYPLEATDFDWVITVPAIWRARGKQMMREAGYKVSIHSACTKFLPTNPPKKSLGKYITKEKLESVVAIVLFFIVGYSSYCSGGITVAIYRQDFVLKRHVANYKKLQHQCCPYQMKGIQTNYH